MQLIKDIWTKKDIEEFYQYQETLKGSEYDREWEQRIINTKMPCLARTASKSRAIAKQIYKGNYLSFLDNIEVKSLCDSQTFAFLICKIKDFKVFKKYLMKFIKSADNWASCDTLKFEKYDYQDLYKLALKLIASKKEFVRRIGINIFFEIYKEEKYAKEAFKIIDSFKDCNQYYVNMVCAWLLSFLYIKYPQLTLEYLKHHNTSKFIINKAISKCNDSYRVTDKEKAMLKTFRIK